MNHTNLSIAAVATVVPVPLALFLRAFSASPLPTPAPYLGPVPSATPPKDMAVVAVMTGVNHRVAAYGYRGGSLFERRDFSIAGTLVDRTKSLAAVKLVSGEFELRPGLAFSPPQLRHFPNWRHRATVHVPVGLISVECVV